MDDVEQIKARLPLEEIIGEVVVLKSAGSNRLMGLCPFHSEKTPSFSVNTELGMYYCFGCKAKGDLLDFVQQNQSVGFRDALELLAQRAGVELSGPRGPKDIDLFDLNELAQAYFSEGYVASETAKHYLTGRGFTAETVEAWGLGYAPDSWHGLIDYARALGVMPEKLERAGLVTRSPKNGKHYDFFRHRVTIPICNFGRIVGFSARALAESETAKYLNTPETAIFKKRDLLFGFDQARDVIKEKRAAIAAEGHLDVIAMHQAGYAATVGAMTATLTAEQLARLERLGVDKLYLAFDADDAGENGVLKTCSAVERRMAINVVRLPQKDPAEVLRQDPALFRQALRAALSEAKYRFARVKAKYDLTQPQGRTAALNELRPALQDASTPGDADELINIVVNEMNQDEDRLRRWLTQGRTAPPPQPLRREPATTDTLGDLRTQVMALALSEKVFLKEACSAIEARLPEGDSLRGFAEAARQAEYDPGRVLRHYSEDCALHAYLAGGVSEPRRAFGLALKHYDRVIKTLAPGAVPLLGGAA